MNNGNGLLGRREWFQSSVESLSSVYETGRSLVYRIRALKTQTISGANLWNRVGSLRAPALMQRLINKSGISILRKDMLPCLLGR